MHNVDDAAQCAALAGRASGCRCAESCRLAGPAQGGADSPARQARHQLPSPAPGPPPPTLEQEQTHTTTENINTGAHSAVLSAVVRLRCPLHAPPGLLDLIRCAVSVAAGDRGDCWRARNRVGGDGRVGWRVRPCHVEHKMGSVGYYALIFRCAMVEYTSIPSFWYDLRWRIIVAMCPIRYKNHNSCVTLGSWARNLALEEILVWWK